MFCFLYPPFHHYCLLFIYTHTHTQPRPFHRTANYHYLGFQHPSLSASPLTNMRLSFSPAVAFVLFAGITLAAPPSPSPTAASCDAPTPPPPPLYKAAFIACTPGRGYCGWSLTKNLGMHKDLSTQARSPPVNLYLRMGSREHCRSGHLPVHRQRRRGHAGQGVWQGLRGPFGALRGVGLHWGYLSGIVLVLRLVLRRGQMDAVPSV